MFYQADEEHRFRTEFLLYEKELSRHKGGYYIRELWNAKGKSIHATRLYTLDQSAALKYVDDDPEVIYLPEWHEAHYQPPERSVELSDPRAVSETRKAIKALVNSFLQARENNDFARAEDLQEEIEKAEQYLREVLDSKGGIKTVHDLARRHSQAISHAVHEFIAAVRNKAPKLADYLSSHVVIGRQCYWSENPKSKTLAGQSACKRGCKSTA